MVRFVLGLVACVALHGSSLLTRVFTCSPGTEAKIGTTRLSATHNELRADGRDGFGRQWTWSAPALRCAVFQADLDANGLPDLAMLLDIGVTEKSFAALLFDAHRQPVPWSIEGVLDERQLAMANRRAELAVGDAVYQARNARWWRVRGPAGPDESNGYPASQPATRVVRIGRSGIELADGRRCALPSLIFVQSGPRLMFAPGNDGGTLERIRAAGLAVHLAGRREPNACAPAYLWAGAQ